MINNTRQNKKSQKTHKNVENMPKNCLSKKTDLDGHFR